MWRKFALSASVPMSPMSMTVPKIRFGVVTGLIMDNSRNVTTADVSSGVCSALARRMWQFFFKDQEVASQVGWFAEDSPGLR